MAKAQAKKAGANKSKAALKSRRSVKKASSRKVAPKPVSKRSKSSEPSRKAKKPKPAAKKAAVKKVASRKQAAPVKKKTAKSPSKPVASPKKKSAKQAKKNPAKGAKAKATARPAKAPRAAKIARKKAEPAKPRNHAPDLKAAAVAGTAVLAAAGATAAAVIAKDKKQRRPRLRIQSDGAPVAAWLNQGDKPRPSSFIPAPARAEAPSLIAAPPASSDRLIRSEDLTDLAVRTVPVRVDVEQAGGRVMISVNPEDVMLKTGEGIEWDFRYFGGADVTVDRIIIDFESSPFASHTFESRKPGTARPHRQLSGGVQAGAPRRLQYRIRAMTPFQTELAVLKPWVTVR